MLVATHTGFAIARLRLSAPVYFGCVALLTAVGVGVAMLFRPTLAYSIRETLGLERPTQARPDSFYAVRVEPLFEAHCVSCHGERRQKAELRLDSFAGALQGGKRGPVIDPGNIRNSELVARITLPASDDKAMPPEGRPSLSTDDITVIKLWIAAGASGTQPVGEIHGAPEPVREVKFPEIDATAVARERAQLAAILNQLQARFPGVLAYESRNSADLEVNAALLGNAFDDAALAALDPLRERIVRADLSGTSISDVSAPALAGWKRIRTLRLANTAVTDATARALAVLDSLRALIVVGTVITEQSLTPLRAKGVRIYDGNYNQVASNAKP